VFNGWLLLKFSVLSVIQRRVPLGGAGVKHHHEKAHQFLFVLSGEVMLEIKDKKLVLGPQ
jgi:mannose-6-phosphate isomerase-like protein (cupin superfamily)